MTTVLLVVGLTLVAVAVATVINNRRPDPPSTPKFAVPQQLDRNDFSPGDTPWLLVLFSSETCLSCRDAREVLEPLDVDGLGYQDLSYEHDRAIHDRYGIDGVPTVVMADADGVVQWSFLGAPPAQAIADLLVDTGLIEPETGTGVDFP